MDHNREDLQEEDLYHQGRMILLMIES